MLSSIFEDDKMLACAVTAQSETELEVGAFLHVPCVKMQMVG